MEPIKSIVQKDGWTVSMAPNARYFYQYYHYTNAADGYCTVALDAKEALAKEGWVVDSKAPVAFLYCMPYQQELDRFKDVPYRIIYTMSESTKLQDGFVPVLNQCQEVWVPSKWVKKVFEDNGVTVPVISVPHGINPDVFKPLERKKSKPFKFFHYNAFGSRKGTEQLVQAFKEEFKDDKEVELHLKTVQNIIPDYATGERIIINRNVIQRNDFATLAQDYHCFVWPAPNEGFGMPPIEMMATGMPVIMSNETGGKEYFNKLYFSGIKTKGTQKVENHPFLKGDLGTYYTIDIEDLKKKMRDVYTNYDKHLKKAEKGSKFIRTHFTYQTFANTMIERFTYAYAKIGQPIDPNQTVQYSPDNYWVTNPQGHSSWVTKAYALSKNWELP